jgi:hypothetical protein
LQNFGIDSQFLGLASSLIRNLWNQIAATRQGCPWILMTSPPATGRRRNVGRRYFQRCPNGLRALIAARDRLSASSIDAMTFASLAEQPRLSLEARRANHAFLTPPIARQALLVVAPEYNRFAPVLAKPVRPGLGALACGSLLQNYALAVGVARLTGNPVEHAVLALAADAEGNLRRVLRSWPWATRRRIYIHLRRLMDSRSAAKITSGQPNRGRFAARFHKLCSNPTNFGSFRPINCESESRNYARSGRAECRTEGDIETPFGVISMPYALRFCETESEFVRLASKTSRN